MFGMSLSRAVTLGVLLVVGPVFAQIDRPQSTTDKKEIDCLQGEWKVVGWEEEGATADTTTFQGKKFVIRGSEIAGELRLASKMSFKLDFAKSPKEIDLTARDGWLKGNTEPGIYEIDGQRLRICLGGKTRPKEFATTPVSGMLLLTLEKEMPAPSVKEKKLTVDLAKELLPPAAGISNSDFEKQSEYPRPDLVKSKSLSLVLLTLRPPQKPDAAMDEEFRYLGEQINGSDVVKAMWISKDKGYASFIQPKYITECSCESTAERAEGVVTFKSDLFAGRIPFVAQATKDGWVITEFRLPQHKTRVVRDKDGVWSQEALEGGRMDAQKDGEPILKRFVLKEADVTDLAKMLSPFFKDARIVAAPHTKSLLVQGASKTLDRLTTVIELLDQPADANATFLKQPEQAKVKVAGAEPNVPRLWTLEGELKAHPKFLYRYYLVLLDGQKCALYGADHGREPEHLTRVRLPTRVRVRGVLGAAHHDGGTAENPSPFPEGWTVFMDVHELDTLK